MEFKFLFNHVDSLKKLLDRENVIDFLKSHQLDEMDILELSDRLNDILAIFVSKKIKTEPTQYEEIAF